ncbi:carboxymuconolactone decarboxylase family protein [Mycobacterium sp.]|uniref:carboxymuconolactone decarboxylase family protein n=1 Tax=Mycobacterium sp. TaxID=1785 RepID=UPI002B96CD25|nr:carboxymuconolactone decarboxylase family protein [Mycobacterium sp.]HTQ18124.1 carboxymuconolactone decarboxylase family protein [Mycobacterium sp.]
MNIKTTIRSIVRPTDPEDAAPQPPITQPDGKWIEMDYPRRIPPLQSRELRLWQRGFLTLIRVLAGETYDYTCFRLTARLGKVMPLHTLFFTQLLQHGRIPGDESERIVIRVAWRAGCQYEYAHHTRMALELGVPRAEIESLTNEADESWSPRLRAFMMAADELIATRTLSPLTYEDLRRELDPDQILEFTTLVGHYVMASMMLSVAGCPIEPAFELRQPAGASV